MLGQTPALPGVCPSGLPTQPKVPWHQRRHKLKFIAGLWNTFHLIWSPRDVGIIVSLRPSSSSCSNLQILFKVLYPLACRGN